MIVLAMLSLALLGCYALGYHAGRRAGEVHAQEYWHRIYWGEVSSLPESDCMKLLDDALLDEFHAVGLYLPHEAARSGRAPRVSNVVRTGVLGPLPGYAERQQLLRDQWVRHQMNVLKQLGAAPAPANMLSQLGATATPLISQNPFAGVGLPMRDTISGYGLW